jgi:hypothetical protein
MATTMLPPTADGTAGGDCGEAAPAAVVTSKSSGEAVMPAVEGALAAPTPAIVPKPPPPLQPKPLQEEAANATHAKRKRPSGIWNIYKLRKELDAGISRRKGRALTEVELQKKKAKLAALEEEFGQASRKHIVEPILKTLDIQHNEQQQMHQRTHDMMLGRVDPEELGYSTTEALAVGAF